MAYQVKLKLFSNLFLAYSNMIINYVMKYMHILYKYA